MAPVIRCSSRYRNGSLRSQLAAATAPPKPGTAAARTTSRRYRKLMACHGGLYKATLSRFRTPVRARARLGTTARRALCRAILPTGGAPLADRHDLMGLSGTKRPRRPQAARVLPRSGVPALFDIAQQARRSRPGARRLVPDYRRLSLAHEVQGATHRVVGGRGFEPRNQRASGARTARCATSQVPVFPGCQARSLPLAPTLGSAPSRCHPAGLQLAGVRPRRLVAGCSWAGLPRHVVQPSRTLATA
jgi:hypothetical protein